MIQRMLTKKKAGFTLIELMIVVAIIGILAAIAIPAFIGYVKRSKTSEATANLKNMFTGAASYYANESWGTQALPTASSTAIASTSCTVATASSTNTPGAGKTILDWEGEADSFQDIGFSIADGIYYQYHIRGSDGACGHSAEQALYSFDAEGDLDGDSTTSLFEIVAGSSTQNVLYRGPGIYRQNELE